MPSLDELKEKYRLSPDKIDEIAEVLIENYTLGARPAKEPIAVILGGQPGAGKSELTTAAQSLVGEQAVICNADDYRDWHPKATEIKRLHEKAYPDITADYSKPWNDRLKDHCEQHRLHFVLETTFS